MSVHFMIFGSIHLLFLGCQTEEIEEVSAHLDPSPILTDANNFSYSSRIDIQRQEVKANTDVWISWSTLTVDMLGHEFDSAEIENVTLVVFGGMDEEALETAVATNDLSQSSVRVFMNCDAHDSGCWLSEFNVLTTDIDIEERFNSEEGIWMVALSGSGSLYRKLLILLPSETTEQTEASFSNEEGMFIVDADLRGQEVIPIPLGEDITFSWSNLTRDGQHSALPLHKIDQVDIAWYSDVGLNDLEEKFLDIELLADEHWTAGVDGLSEFSTAELPSFDGFDADGQWLLALRCSTCASPMPLFLGVLDPR
jgi:hypothetical protein